MTGLVASQLDAVYLHLPDLVIVKEPKNTEEEEKKEKKGAKHNKEPNLAETTTKLSR